MKFIEPKKKKNHPSLQGVYNLGPKTIKHSSNKHLSNHKPKIKSDFLQLTSNPIKF